MLILAVLINVLAAAGAIFLAARYVQAASPLDYHVEILGGAVEDRTAKILGALYKGMGGAFASLGLGIILVSLFGVWNDLFWAKLTVLVMFGVAGYFATIGARGLEAATGVTTPWRPAAGITGAGIVAFVLSIL